MMDKLSALSEDLLNRILCFLPQKIAVQTCVLSKSWRHRGSTRSKLELSQSTDFRGDPEIFVSVLRMPPFSPVKFDLPSIALKLESLSLGGGSLKRIASADEKLLVKHLRRLSLEQVCIDEDTLEALLSTCPLIRYLCIEDCLGFTNVNVKNAHNLKDFNFHKNYTSTEYKIISIEIDGAPALETVSIVGCEHLNFHGKYFPRLQDLELSNVELSAESLGFFTSKYMPSLVKLELCCCYGFKEFRLSSTSIKYLNLHYVRDLIKVTVDTPNIICFELKIDEKTLPTISFITISREWESSIDLFLCSAYNNIELHELLKSLSQSRITLEHCFNYPSCNPKYFEDTNLSPLAVVEHLILRRLSSSPAVPVIFDSLFSVCRPKYIYAKNSDEDN